MNVTSRTEKVDEKIWSFELWSVICPQKMNFLQFCADLSKKLKSVKGIYIYASESSQYTLSENDMVYRVLSHLS